ncbi:phenoloxidase-activating factor 2-like isoform X2 [Metopolophium dirhodum]|uniref:phenoloxidase-activating factor 2-like isoform X2 n=1 Tax=Metopolophium dirhodum TaxID=44670 RepID=UPI00299045ED|nr:phenoloxidase-activating factor 2-like isoform X2 [Metopolophium dirhodum]
MLGPTLKRFSASPLSVLLSVTLLLQVTVTVVSGKGQDATPDQCKCLPYYLCENGTIVTSGNGLIDVRSGGLKCDGKDVKCCYKSMKSKASNDMDLTTQEIDETILVEMSTLIPQTMPSNTCKCVPYYLCGNGMIVTSGKGLIDERFGGDVMCSDILDVCCNESMKSKATSKNDVKRNNLDKKIWSLFLSPPHPPPPSDRCTCVPHNLCRNKTVNVARQPIIIDIRINKDRCPNSVDVCCYDPIKSTKPTEIPDPEHRTICGHWNPLGVKFTITGESHNEAQFGEFPWMMAILKLEANQSKTYICGGSLIHPRVVLTAFHCVKGKNPNDLVIRAGEWDTQTENEPLPSQDGQALKIINHADFEPDELLNDVALIIVIKPFSLSKNVGTICLPSPNYIFSNRCYASGWGKKEFGKLGVNQVIMKKIDLPIVPRTTCLELLRKTRLGVDYILPEDFICAGGEIGKDTCQGDGGSPLMCPIENRPKQFQQAGIVAWGIGCGTETPGVYVDVALFRNWIDEQMAKEKLSTIYYDPDYVPTN